VLEAFTLAEKYSGRPMKHTYVEQNRIGDHICYYSDLRKMRAHYPKWDITKSLEQTIQEIVEAGSSGSEPSRLSYARTQPVLRDHHSDVLRRPRAAALSCRLSRRGNQGKH